MGDSWCVLYGYVQNDPVNWIDPWGLLSAGQLGIGNPGSYGGKNTCESMYDETPDDPHQDAIERNPLIDPGVIIGVGAGGAKLVLGLGKKVSDKVTKEILLRRKLGADGGISRHIIEKLEGKTISKTHQVWKDGKIIHQHKDHTGKYGESRRFNDKWTGTDTID